MKNKPLGSTLLEKKSGTKKTGKVLNFFDKGALLTTAAQAPYSYEEVDKADCQTLAAMIAKVQYSMSTDSYLDSQAAAYNQWLAYAQERYQQYCVTKIQDYPPMEPVDLQLPPYKGDVPLTTTATVDNPMVEPEPLIKTLQTPNFNPYPSGGSGGGGSTTPVAPGTKKPFNWFWVVVGGLAVGGFLLFKPKAS